MDASQTQLWTQLAAFDLNDPEASFSFTDRLARENGWSIEFSLRCVEEYKRFIFLICITDYSLTPSDQVDQVWHLHLLYTRSYWDEMCEGILKMKIHHGPTKGGEVQRDLFNDLYTKAKQRYSEVFLEEPPLDIWPKNEVRFSEISFQRTNKSANWIIPKPTLFR